MGTSKKSGETCQGKQEQQNACQTPKQRFSKSHHFLTKWNLDMRYSRELSVRVLRRPLKQFETGTPLGRAKKTVFFFCSCYVAYIALPSWLPGFREGWHPLPRLLDHKGPPPSILKFQIQNTFLTSFQTTVKPFFTKLGSNWSFPREQHEDYKYGGLT